MGLPKFAVVALGETGTGAGGSGATGVAEAVGAAAEVCCIPLPDQGLVAGVVVGVVEVVWLQALLPAGVVLLGIGAAVLVVSLTVEAVIPVAERGWPFQACGTPVADGTGAGGGAGFGGRF